MRIQWKRLGSLGLLSLLWVGQAVGAGAAGSGETISFRFAPPDGTECVQTISATREKVFEGVGRQVDAWESKTAISYRRAGDGYLVTARPIALKMTRDGQPLQDPIRELLQGIVIRYRIGADGRIESVEGFAGLAEKIQAMFPTEMAATLTPLLSEETLVTRETAEWDARVGDFAGRDFSVGDSIESEMPYTLPNGRSITYFIRTSFPGREPCASGSCARVSVHYDSDASALAQLAGDAMRGMAPGTRAEAGIPGARDARLSGTATRLIDPATMLIHEESQSRTISMTMEVPGRGPVPSRMTEERTYRFEYP